MDPGEALGDDGPHAEIERGERGLLAARALPVVVPADDDPAPPFGGARGKVRIEPAEHRAAAGGNVRPDRDAQRTVGGHVTGRDVVGPDDEDAPGGLLPANAHPPPRHQLPPPPCPPPPPL